MAAHSNDPRVLAGIRARSGADRVRFGISLRRMTDCIAMAGIRHRHPTWTDTEARAELTRLIARSRDHYDAYRGSPV